MILNRTDAFLARRTSRTMGIGIPTEKQPEEVKGLLVLLEERVGFPDEAFVDLEDAMAWCLGSFPKFNKFLDDASAMFSLMDEDSDGEEPKGGGGKGKAEGKKGSKAEPKALRLHAGEGVHSGEGLRSGGKGYGKDGKYTEEAVYAEGARLQEEGERDESVTEEEFEEEPEPEEEEESGGEVMIPKILMLRMKMTST